MVSIEEQCFLVYHFEEEFNNRYHKQFHHVISASSGQPFASPLEIKISLDFIQNDKHSSDKYLLKIRTLLPCHECHHDVSLGLHLDQKPALILITNVQMESLKQFSTELHFKYIQSDSGFKILTKIGPNGNLVLPDGFLGYPEIWTAFARLARNSIKSAAWWKHAIKCHKMRSRSIFGSATRQKNFLIGKMNENIVWHQNAQIDADTMCKMDPTAESDLQSQSSDFKYSGLSGFTSSEKYPPLLPSFKYVAKIARETLAADDRYLIKSKELRSSGLFGPCNEL